MKGVKHFWEKRKSAPRYVRPFPILNRVGKLAYKLELLDQLSTIYPVFHISMFKKHTKDEVQKIILDMSGVQIHVDT